MEKNKKSNKGGRPRSKNYEKNQAKLLRAFKNKGIPVGNTSIPVGNTGIPVEENTPYPTQAKETSNAESFLKSHVNSPVYAMTKNFMKSMLLSKQKQKENKTVLYDFHKRLMNDGVLYRSQDRISYRELRMASENTSIAGAIHQMRSDDVRLHCQLSDELGFWFFNQKQKDKQMIEEDFTELANLLMNMGISETSNSWQRRDRMPDVLEMATRDVLAIDRVAYLIHKSRDGEIHSIHYLDPATIYCVDPSKGYKGNTKITHVQAIDGQVVETFFQGQIYLNSKNKRSDIRFRYEGFSAVESCITEITAMVHALKNNMDRFNRRKPPNMILSTKSKLGEQSRDLLEELWENYFDGGSDEFRFPLLDGLDSLEVHRLGVDNDMIFERLMKWVSTLIFVRHGTDPAELGMRLDGNQTMSEPSLDGRAKLSRDRSHGAIMRFHESCLIDIFNFTYKNKPMQFYFTGITTQDKDHVLERNIKKLGNFLPLGKILKEMGQPTYSEMVKELVPDDKDSQEKAKKLDLAILNPQFVNLFSQSIMAPADQEEVENFDADEGENFDENYNEDNEYSQEDEDGNIIG